MGTPATSSQNNLDVKTVTVLCEKLLKKGHVEAVKEILKSVNAS